MVGNQRLGGGSFFGGSEETSPLPPSKGEMRRASIHEQYDVETGESASRTGDYGTGGANRRLGKARKAERTGTSETSETSETSGASGTGETGETSGTGGEQKKLPLVRQLNSLLYTNY